MSLSVGRLPLSAAENRIHGRVGSFASHRDWGAVALGRTYGHLQGKPLLPQARRNALTKQVDKGICCANVLEPARVVTVSQPVTLARNLRSIIGPSFVSSSSSEALSVTLALMSPAEALGDEFAQCCQGARSGLSHAFAGPGLAHEIRSD
jgi:hypothetical protein